MVMGSLVLVQPVREFGIQWLTPIFGIDRESAYVRLAAWDTPRGWHQRIYSDFYWVAEPGFLQPGRVRLYYDGAKSVDIRWTSAAINEELPDDLFVLGNK